MAPFDFPATPAPGEVYTPANGPSYQWDGEKWKGGGQAREPDEQFFDLSGLTQRDIVVPTWAKGCTINASFLPVAATDFLALRVSTDGSTFISTGYQLGGPYHSNNVATWSFQANTAVPQFYLSYPRDNINFAHNITFDMTLVSSAGANSLITGKSQFVNYANASNFQTWFLNGYFSTGSPIAAKALRFINPGSVNAFGAGSWLRVKWLGDTGQLKVGTSVPDANTDGKLYGRKDNAWIEASPRPQSAAGIGQWVSLAANGVALVLPAGGTWAWFFGGTNTGSGAVTSAFSGGVSAGGTQLAAGAAGTYWQGFAWRIA